MDPNISSSSSPDAVKRRIEVVMVAFPAQGHLNQLLHLSRSLATRGLTVLFVTTSSHIHQVRHRAEGWDPQDFDIRFEELPMPDVTDTKPDLQYTHKFPSHLMPLFEAFDNLLEPFDRLMQKICSADNSRVEEGPITRPRGIVMVHDSLLGWVQIAAAKYGIPAYIFNCVSAYFAMSFNRQGERGCGLKLRYPDRFLQFLSRQQNLQRLAKGHIFNSCYQLESESIDRLREAEYAGKPMWTVGPLLPRPLLNYDGERMRAVKKPQGWECLRWLDTQAAGSVVYVSFGSLSSLSPQQIRELAVGLECSQQPFLWVLRVADSAFFSSTDCQADWLGNLLPDGFEDRVEGRGLVVRNWAPQLHILAHKSTGGFLTHCGWNSTVESIGAGVPMLAWPLHSDQFTNSIFVARELQVGVEVKEAWNSSEEEDEIVKAEEIERAIKRLMVDEEGLQMRRRASQLKWVTQKAIAEGGSSCKELDSFVHHLTTTVGVLNELDVQTKPVHGAHRQA